MLSWKFFRLFLFVFLWTIGILLVRNPVTWMVLSGVAFLFVAAAWTYLRLYKVK